jgi:hypothetical protein
MQIQIFFAKFYPLYFKIGIQANHFEKLFPQYVIGSICG